MYNVGDIQIEFRKVFVISSSGQCTKMLSGETGHAERERERKRERERDSDLSWGSDQRCGSERYCAGTVDDIESYLTALLNRTLLL